MCVYGRMLVLWFGFWLAPKMKSTIQWFCRENGFYYINTHWIWKMSNLWTIIIIALTRSVIFSHCLFYLLLHSCQILLMILKMSTYQQYITRELRFYSRLKLFFLKNYQLIFRRYSAIFLIDSLPKAIGRCESVCMIKSLMPKRSISFNQMIIIHVRACVFVCLFCVHSIYIGTFISPSNHFHKLNAHKQIILYVVLSGCVRLAQWISI